MATSISGASWDSSLLTSLCLDTVRESQKVSETDHFGSSNEDLDTTMLGIGPWPQEKVPAGDTLVSTKCFTPRIESGAMGKLSFGQLTSPMEPPLSSDVEWDASLSMPMADGFMEEARGCAVPPLRLSQACTSKAADCHGPLSTDAELSSSVNVSQSARGNIRLSVESSLQALGDEGRGSLPVKPTPRPSVPGAAPLASALERSLENLPNQPRDSFATGQQKQLEVLSAQVAELRHRLDRESRDRSTWEQRALDAESTASRLAADMEARPAASSEVSLKAELAAARHSLDNARMEASQARQDADTAWHQVDAARNDAALVQEALLGMGDAATAGRDAPDTVDKLRAKNQEIDQLTREMATLREENAELRNRLQSALAAQCRPKLIEECGGGDASEDSSPVGKAALNAEKEQLHGYVVSLQKRLFELEAQCRSPAGRTTKPESERVSELERNLLEAQRKISKMSGFIGRFIEKAHRPLQSIQLVCKSFAQSFEAGLAECVTEVPQSLFDPKSDDMPKSLVNILCQLRFASQVLAALVHKLHGQPSTRFR